MLSGFVSWNNRLLWAADNAAQLAVVIAHEIAHQGETP
ncbi:MAG: hypothetical protein F6K42_16110 [Leptolyngbya sp. SIO1D8]|nr:hypothetical protein [Leptolyngbya sp. SIO1D8]